MMRKLLYPLFLLPYSKGLRHACHRHCRCVGHVAVQAAWKMSKCYSAAFEERKTILLGNSDWKIQNLYSHCYT